MGDKEILPGRANGYPMDMEYDPLVGAVPAQLVKVLLDIAQKVSARPQVKDGDMQTRRRLANDACINQLLKGGSPDDQYLTVISIIGPTQEQVDKLLTCLGQGTVTNANAMEPLIAMIGRHGIEEQIKRLGELTTRKNGSGALAQLRRAGAIRDVGQHQPSIPANAGRRRRRH